LNLERCIEIQKKIASKALIEDKFRGVRAVAGVDQAFFDERIISGIVILDYNSLEMMESLYSIARVKFPYIPTFLSFREGPAIIKAFSLLRKRPDLLMVDGCGIVHPRFAGLATHVGVVLNIPTIGIAKRLLCGEYERVPEEENEYSIISYNGRSVGALLKSKKNCNPIVISPGHRVSLSTSIEMVKHCLKGYKLPETTRHAHIYVNEVKKKRIKPEESS
jgi:deoxyribonuclease V